jgi:hypothetical protein
MVGVLGGWGAGVSKVDDARGWNGVRDAGNGLAPWNRLAGGGWAGCDDPLGPRYGQGGLTFGVPRRVSSPPWRGARGVLGPVGGCPRGERSGFGRVLGAGTMGIYPAGVAGEGRPSLGIGRLEGLARRGPAKVSRVGRCKRG